MIIMKGKNVPELTRQEADILEWLRDREGEMIDLLRQMVDQDSPSHMKEETDRAGIIIENFLREREVATERFEHDSLGFMLKAQTGSGSSPHRLLLAHRDTVFPIGEAGRRPFNITGDLAYGPGVADMKAGLVLNAFILAAFQDLGIPIRVTGLFSSDEEIGSPFSRDIITREAKGACCVLNSEPGRMSGNVVTKRKGGRFMKLLVTGRPAHSGADISKGASAIEALARKIVKLHALTDHATGLTVNVGLVSGGTSVNTSAPSATAGIDLRFVNDAQSQEAMRAINEIVGNTEIEGTAAALSIEGEFLPMYENEETLSLFRTYRACAALVGYAVGHEDTGACSESGFAQATDSPTLCAIGPVGGRAHTPDEYVEVATIVPRTCAAALTLLRHNIDK